MNNTFTNPYINGDPSIDTAKPNEAKSRRVTFSVHDSDKTLLRVVRPITGTETTVCTILYRKFCECLRANGWTDQTMQKNLEEFAANLVMTNGQSKRKSK